MTTYTAITFAPVQGFIEKSRKLRDLYGSSFLLSYLAKTICDKAKAEGFEVVSPAIINVTQGTPNQIIIQGEGDRIFDRGVAKTAFYTAWQNIVNAIRIHIEETLSDYQPYHWQRAWNHWANYAWEFFWGNGTNITEAREAINEIKRCRNWVGVNWVGESSTLSGGDAVAWYGMSDEINPKETSMGEIDGKINEFYRELSQKLSNSIIDADEQLSIPELIKRLITLRDITSQLTIKEDDYQTIEIEFPQSFKDINRKKDDPEENRWTGWFQGDGDKIGDYLKGLSGDESQNLNHFSKAMMDWGKGLKYTLPKPNSDTNKLDREGRIIYAGGDDFLGVLYRNEAERLTAQECLNWFYKFPDVWKQHGEKITVSIGFVWAAPGVPQRDVLQHCRETESLAKANGRDRLAIRILFNSGNHLDWHCPWWFLDILHKYCDRNNVLGETANWTHIYNDVAVLESRHAFKDNKAIALELFEIYFGKEQRKKLEDCAYLWNDREIEPIKTGILGEKKRYLTEADKDFAITNWIINLAKVGFHLCQ